MKRDLLIPPCRGLRWYSAVGLVTFLPLAASAQQTAASTKALATCAAEANSVKRLACFDELARRAGAVPVAAVVPSKGRWSIEEEINKIDDSKTVVAQLRAESAIAGWPRKTYVPELLVRCQRGKTELYINNGMSPLVEYGQTGSATVTFRFGKDKAKQLLASKSTDGEALFFPNAVALLKEAEKHDTLLYGFTPFNSPPVMTTFNLTGIDSVIKAVRAPCKW